MRKLILRSGYALGDIVMLTAAVRDLHHCYPDRFVTDVRTFFPEVWEHNPFVTKLSENDPEVELIDCAYPLIDRADTSGYHCLHGYIDFLNRRLRLGIKLTSVKGDIHLSDLEKRWVSQVYEVTGSDTPFWIVSAGGKYDITIKWWETSRFQAVVDSLRDKVQFVQVGRWGDHHPKLDGVIDLRGKTELRQLLRLVHHSDGVLCPVTGLMHLAAAVSTRPGKPPNRACVVIAGGREPSHWEAYPAHQFMHSVGALGCCARKACWKSRTLPLRDGASQDRRDHRCEQLAGELPACMDLILPAQVVDRIQLYYRAGALQYLSPAQQIAGRKGVKRTLRNRFDSAPLNIHEAGLRCDAFAANQPDYPGGFRGRGVVVCAGGSRYFTNAWVCVNMLRRHGCRLPIELWHLGDDELSEQMKALVEPLGVECVDAFEVRKRHPARILRGWELKPYAIIHSKFKEVLFVDADNVAVADPEFLFDSEQFRATGAIFWPDYHGPGTNRKGAKIWRSCGVREPREPEFETGQMVLDKERCWGALNLCMWFNENSDFYYRYLHGDKETFHIAFRKARKRYSLVPIPIHSLEYAMCQHDFRGERIFQHRNTDKWDLLLCNRKMRDFWHEDECRAYILQLRSVWSGRIEQGEMGMGTLTSVYSGEPRIETVMISCAQRDRIRAVTLENLRKTDWNGWPIHVQMDVETGGDTPERRQTRCARQALKFALARQPDYILFLEDDLVFNRHIRHNLSAWKPLRKGTMIFGGVYNPGLRELACDVVSNSRSVAPNAAFGSQALLIAASAADYIVRNWNRVSGMQDIRITRLAGRLGQSLLYHAPSLVQHLETPSTWGGARHQSWDFDQNWRA